MKTLSVNIFLAIAIVFHGVMLWNLAAHFQWQPGFPPTWLPQKTGAEIPDHWKPGNALPWFRESPPTGLEKKWVELKQAHIRSRELIAVPLRQTDNFGLDFLVRDANNTDPGGDFFQLMRSGFDVRQGTSIYENYPADMDPTVRKLLDDSTPFHPPNRYPPGFAYTVGVALSHMKPWTAYLAWIILHEIILLYCVILSRKWAAVKTLRFRVAAAMWLGFLPWYLELYMGQTTFIIMAATFILGTCLDDRTGSLHTGLWWTASLITKPISLLYVPLLIRKRYFGILMTGLAVSVGSAWMYFRHHPGDARVFLGWMSGQEMVLTLGNYSFQSFLYRFHLSGTATHVIAGLLILIGLYMTFRRRDTHSVRLLTIWVCIYFLAYTHVWQHHLVLLLPAMILSWLYSGRIRYVFIWLLATIPSSFYLFNNHWNWIRDILYLGGAALPVLLLFADQLVCRYQRATGGE
ncbi:DUF2029 domain-containing protein [bacterium]|nr:DUF2029 domain-containing protein [candidate division CSSED10-310 bacterium]